MKQEKCENCDCYIQHFRKNKNCFVTINCGHCTNIWPNGRFRKTDRICEFYQEKDKQQKKQERIISAAENLSLIDERLNELKEIIKDEN